MIAIQTANLTKKYGDIIAINGVDLEVEAGEIVGCLGPERSGKTTLLRLLTGLVRPTLGDSTVLGLSSVKESRKLRAKSGIVTDTAACIGSMSALENLLMFASMYGMRKEQARTHAAQLLKKLDLWNARDRKVYTFSTEMCRRLSLARALVHRPQIVFSDGLPGGEQAVSDAMVLRTLSDYAKETGATVLLCTDHLESAEEICTSFAVLEHGFLRASGDLSMLTAASELTPMAVIRVSDTQKMPEDFTLHDGAWEKPIESEADMPELISGLVTAVSFILFFVVTAIGDMVLKAPFFFDLSWFVLVFLLSPAITVLGVTFATMLTVKARSTAESIQISGYIVLPILLIFIGQIMGLYRLNSIALLILTAIIVGIDLCLFNFGFRRFTAEKLLTRPPEKPRKEKTNVY